MFIIFIGKVMTFLYRQNKATKQNKTKTKIQKAKKKKTYFFRLITITHLSAFGKYGQEVVPQTPLSKHVYVCGKKKVKKKDIFKAIKQKYASIFLFGEKIKLY